MGKKTLGQESSVVRLKCGICKSETQEITLERERLELNFGGPQIHCNKSAQKFYELPTETKNSTGHIAGVKFE